MSDITSWTSYSSGNLIWIHFFEGHIQKSFFDGLILLKSLLFSRSLFSQANKFQWLTVSSWQSTTANSTPKMEIWKKIGALMMFPRLSIKLQGKDDDLSSKKPLVAFPGAIKLACNNPSWVQCIAWLFLWCIDSVECQSLPGRWSLPSHRCRTKETYTRSRKWWKMTGTTWETSNSNTYPRAWQFQSQWAYGHRTAFFSPASQKGENCKLIIKNQMKQKSKSMILTLHLP